MNSDSSTKLLRRALIGNAIFSAICGSTLLAAAGPLGPVLGVPTLALQLIGLSLLPFALGLWRNARRPYVQRGEAWLAVWLDAAWVVGSAALVLGELWALTSAGSWTVIAIADVVLFFAALQAIGLWRSARRAAHA